MYYSHKCSYCGKTFYIYSGNKEQASHQLFAEIKKHLKDYGEDHKEYEFDEDPVIEANQMYQAMSETPTAPSGGYELK